LPVLLTNTKVVKQKIVIDESKIENATKGLAKTWSKNLQCISETNVSVICNYIEAQYTEINPTEYYRRDCIKFPYLLSRFLKDKPFKNITRLDILNFLNTFRKTESDDPMHKWIGTYNIILVHLTKFFKWLYYPYIEPKKRPKPNPVQNIQSLKRKEKSNYSPSDMWTQDDDLLFLKYCPSKRDKAYHMIARDTAARPHEILGLKIKSIQWNKSTDGRIYATVLVNGKTGSRSLLLTDSIPYLKEYLSHEHPMAENLEAPLISSIGVSLGKHMNIVRLGDIYNSYKKKVFPKLSISEEDKEDMQRLLTKPFNPYVRRHSSLTEKARILNEATLRVYSGWTPNSGMPQKYLHYFGDEANQDLLIAYGLASKDDKIDTKLRSKHCPNCNNPNQPNSKYCHTCGLVLSFDAYQTTLEDQKKKDKELKQLKEKYELDLEAVRKETSQKFNQIMAMIQQNPQLLQIKPNVLIGKEVEDE
jgi:integrase